MATKNIDGKPDGSAYRDHMEKLNARNVEAKKVAQAERREREREQAVSRHKSEVRLDKDLMRGSGKRGKAEIKS
ncbi:MAG: hypothetical protein ACR2HC_06430 [Thermoleophilaceae bacterium]